MDAVAAGIRRSSPAGRGCSYELRDPIKAL